MGVYIKDMEMPKKDGSWVTLRVFPDGKCFLYSWCEIDFDFMEHLTAVPVPPHGRLIDSDELRHVLWKRAKEFSNSEYGDGVKCGLADAREYIKIAPTVIPASKEGET